MRGRKKSEETRKAIVQCAAEIFSQREFHEVLTDDIAQRVGIGKGTIYRYFDSKEDLYLAAISAGLDGFNLAILSVLQQDAPLHAMVEAVARTMISHLWRHRDFFVLMHRLESKLKPAQRADWRNGRSEMIGMVCRVIERAISRGEIAPLNSRMAVEVLFGMIRAVCVYRDESDRPEDLIRLVVGVFLGGVAGHAGMPAERSRTLKVVKGGAPRT
jgi:AcrR family transcriptional regulator